MALPVSAKWKAAIGQQFRYPAYMRVILTVVPPGMREGAVTSTSFTESISSVATITDGKSDYCASVATLETNRWKGDGSMYLPSATSAQNLPIEWWSNTGKFTASNPVTLTFTFDNLYTIPGLFVTWDTETNSWPTNLEVTGYNGDGTQVSQYTITSITQVEQYVACPFSDIKSLTLAVKEWSKPDWRVRINEIVFGLYMRFNNDNFTKAAIKASSPLISDALPSFLVDFTINNQDKIFDPKLKTGNSKYLAVRQQVQIQWGFEVEYGVIEWLDPWSMYLSAWRIPTDQPEVTMTTSTRLSFIEKNYTQGVYDGTTRTFKALAESILQNSGIITEESGEQPWELPATLANFVTKAPVPIVASNAALQLICNASGHLLGTNPINGFVRIKSDISATDYEVGLTQQLGDPAYAISDRLKSVVIGLRSFSPKAAAEEVYKVTLQLAGTKTIELTYNNGAIVQNPSATISGATITSATYYARSARLIVVAPVAGAAVTITINGTVVEESTSKIKTYENTLVPNGLEIEVDNPLITEMSVATSLTNYLVAYYSRRNTLSIPYLGYPELECSDRISCPTTYGATTGDIVGLSLDFNGGFSGKLDVVSTEV